MIAVLDLSFSDIVIAAAFLAVILDRVADARGWSRSSKTLRRENEDLVRRNTELEQTVARHEQKILEQGAEIESMRSRIIDLEKRDQAAVLAAIKLHEEQANHRHDRTIGVMSEIRDILKEGASS